MIQKDYYLICRNKKCTFSKKKSKEYGIEHYCPSCGSDLIWKCPECDQPLQNRDKKFCSLCKTPLEIDVKKDQAGQSDEPDE